LKLAKFFEREQLEAHLKPVNSFGLNLEHFKLKDVFGGEQELVNFKLVDSFGRMEEEQGHIKLANFFQREQGHFKLAA
jgi:hypothetical protein